MDTKHSSSQHLQNSSNIGNYGSVNGNHVINDGPIGEDLRIGRRVSMSWKFFILLTVFDVLFTLLLWIICTVVSGGSAIDVEFKDEVLNYNVESSLFDVVVLALTRLVLVAVFYFLLGRSHWWMIAVTTAGTTIFIITKVFLYKWVHSYKTPAAVVLLLTSFVLSWAEAWFLGFKVLPSDGKAAILLPGSHDSGPRLLPHPPLSRSQSDDGSAFYSPPESDGEETVKEHNSVVSEVEWLSPKNSNELAT